MRLPSSIMGASRLARFAACLYSICLPGLAFAHPVPRKAHDRTIDIRLEATRVVVRYRLEVDPLTVVYDDLPAIDDQVDVTKLKKPEEFYDAFTRGYAPILADNLAAKLDGKTLAFRCEKRSHALREDDGKPLDHVRFDFVFHAAWQPTGDMPHTFTFREGNYELESGMIRTALDAAAPVEMVDKTVAPKELQERATRDFGPGDEAKLRKATATFRLPPGSIPTPEPEPIIAPALREPEHLADDHGLFELLFDTSRGLGWLLLLAGAFGAVHALTPGHGKTLVAAYLVGERGTVWHALLLGLSTTVSHTGAVIVVAILMAASGVDITRGLELVAGLMVTLWGFWLLLRRLAGAPDPLQFGGHSHGGVYHTHGHGAEASHVQGAPAPVGTWGVIMLGMIGGMVPCWDAIAILGIAPRRALPLVLAFSAGLAATLVAVGIGVVYIKGFSQSRWGQGRIVRSLPLASAVVILGVGLWMCYRSVHRI